MPRASTRRPVPAVEMAGIRGPSHPPLEGAAIANARGVPGTAGFLARTLHDDRAVLVTAHHVLFAEGAREGEPVVLLHRDGRATRIGVAGWGRRGVVRADEGDAWVDCAVVLLDDGVVPAAWEAEVAPHPTTRPALGARVSKVGAATGVTAGVVVDADFADVATIARRPQPAPRQLLVRGVDPRHPFSAPGDSGAAVRDAHGAIVGLLRGTHASGTSVACTIAPVLWVLHVAACLVGDAAGRSA